MTDVQKNAGPISWSSIWDGLTGYCGDDSARGVSGAASTDPLISPGNSGRQVRLSRQEYIGAGCTQASCIDMQYEREVWKAMRMKGEV